MPLSTRLMNAYFNFIYNPIYDFTTAQISLYQELQRACIDKLKFEDNDEVLCVGVGTGNEILQILEKNSQVSVTGVDTSRRALARAHRKALRRDKRIEAFEMDACKLNFDDESFDKVLCIHVMGFLADDTEATAEIFRVLKNEGQFVITFPSGNSLLKPAAVVGQSIFHNFRLGRWGKATRELLAVVGGVVSLPINFWVRPKRGFYSHQGLKTMLAGLKLKDSQIEEDSVYQDLIIFGTK